jgi:hypothetical protein
MVTIPNAMLIGISSPYARRGLFWNKYKESWGKPGRVLFMRAPTWVMNPILPRDCDDIEDAYATDPLWAAAEYGGEWRSDIESFVSREAVEACVDFGVHERPPVDGMRYCGVVDPSGGSSDSMTLAITHKEGEVGIVDCVREVRPPFSPEAVVAEFAAVFKSYRISKVYGDKFAGEWAREPFRKQGITYDTNIKPKSDLYRDALPLINSGKVRLLDVKRLISQLLNLERNTARGGRDTIDHPRGEHDDLANAVVGALLHATERRPQAYINGQPMLPNGMPDWSAPRPGKPEPPRIRYAVLTEQEDLKRRGLL